MTGLWTLTGPWTHRTRPPPFAKHADAFRTSAHKALSTLIHGTKRNEGDISNELRMGTFLKSLDNSVVDS
jgi:hypothetical protein